MNTPEKFYQAADEVISFLVENLLKLNTIEEECCALNEKFKDYQKRGIRVKGMPKNGDEMWSQYKTRYGEAVTSFCAQQLVDRGDYAHSMSIIGGKIYGEYAYLVYGCELAITMKSNKRAVIEIIYKNPGSTLEQWRKFTLVNDNRWLLTDI